MMSRKSWHGGGIRGQRHFSPISYVKFKKPAIIFAAFFIIAGSLVIPLIASSSGHLTEDFLFKPGSSTSKKSVFKKITESSSSFKTPQNLSVASLALSSAQPGQAMGIAAGSYLTGLSSSSLNSTMSGIAASGAKWIRFDFDWSQIQPNNSSSSNWAPTDAVVAAAAAKHISILGIIDYTPSWARPADCTADSKCGPASDAQYAQFASTLARHYEANVHDWEIWNEPNNHGFWQPTPSSSDYTSLLKAAYPAIHSVSNNETVITAGLSPAATTSSSYSPYDFLKGIYNDGGRQYFDAVAAHPYTFPLSPAANADDAWTQMANPTNSLRSLMVANGDTSKKIWITEFGAPTGGPGPIATLANPNLAANPYVVDDALQAQILQDAINLYKSYNWTGPFFYYTYQDSGNDQSTNENFFGLINYAGVTKPAYQVFKAAANN
jgi:hypothetical protein